MGCGAGELKHNMHVHFSFCYIVKLTTKFSFQINHAECVTKPIFQSMYIYKESHVKS